MSLPKNLRETKISMHSQSTKETTRKRRGEKTFQRVARIERAPESAMQQRGRAQRGKPRAGKWTRTMKVSASVK